MSVREKERDTFFDSEIELDLTEIGSLGAFVIEPKSLVYKKLDLMTDRVKENKQLITKGVWGANNPCTSVVTGNLLTFFTSSYQTSKQKEYYYNVLMDQTFPANEYEFSVAYGNYQGLGGYSGGGQLNDSPTRAIYSQYVALCEIDYPEWNGSKNRSVDRNSSDYSKGIFWSPTGITSTSTNDQVKAAIAEIMSKPPRFINLDGGFFDDVYIINVSSKRLQDKLDPGNWELTLSELANGSNIIPHPDGKVITLIDDSLDSTEEAFLDKKMDVFYGIYSGSISNGIYSKDKHYGYVYPRLGIIVLGGSKLNSELNFNTNVNANVNGNNAFRLFTSISASAIPIGARTQIYSFDARNVKYRTTDYYFLRVSNSEFNYSNNPTFRSGSEDNLRHPMFSNDPKTYITTVGLYNKSYDLLAVAKFSKPIVKSFVHELSVVVKLEY